MDKQIIVIQLSKNQFENLLLKIIKECCHIKIEDQPIYKIYKDIHKILIGHKYKILDKIIFNYSGLLSYKSKEEFEKIIEDLKELGCIEVIKEEE